MITIDKELLYEFLVEDNMKLDATHYSELQKVFNVIFNKYFSKYYSYNEEIFSRCIECVLSRKSHYDSSYSAYNFIFTLFRNEIGNYINKWIKPVDLNAFDVIPNEGRFQTVQPEEELDQELEVIQKYEGYLSGSIDYTYIRIPKAIVIELVSALIKFSRKKIAKSPNTTNADILFYILKNLL